MVVFKHLPDKSAGDFVSIGRTCVIGSIAVSTALGKKGVFTSGCPGRLTPKK
jgi:hypothetical protein